jgi:hypothetical protein
MSGRAGFPTADIDVGLLHDPKVIQLARRLQDASATAAHMAIYGALILESWSRGDRATLDESAPAWWVDSLEQVAENLAAVGLLDEERRIPAHAWTA